jgi:hypothetical protein
MTFLILTLFLAGSPSWDANCDVARIRPLFSRRAAHQRKAIEYLLNADADCRSEERTFARMVALLRSESADPDVRVGVASVLLYSGLELMEPDVRRIVAQPSSPVARDVACLFALALVDETSRVPQPALLRLFATSTGVLHEEAGIVLAGTYRAPTLPAKVRDDLVTLLVSLMLDGARDPLLRGRAIDASTYFSRDSRLTAALLTLSRPDHWFFGVAGSHFPVHSLPSIIDALASRRDEPAVAERLRLLRDDLVKLTETDRVFSQWAIDRLTSIPVYLLPPDDGGDVDRATASLPAEAPDAPVALRISKGAPSHPVVWRSSQSVDVDGDDQPDEVFTSQDPERFYVAVVLYPNRSTSVATAVSFLRAGDSEDSFCGPFESLTRESLSTRAELVEVLGDEPNGYPFGAKAEGLRLVAGECDSFHLFWNKSSEQLDWWRL